MSVNENTVISKTQNWWPKQSQTGVIFWYALVHNIYFNFYFGTQASCFVKFGERGMPTWWTAFQHLEIRNAGNYSRFSILWLLFDMIRRWFRLSNFNKDCSMQTILQLFQKYLVLVQSYLEDTRLRTRVPETEHLKTAQNSRIPKQHCIEFCKLNLSRLATKLALDH